MLTAVEALERLKAGNKRFVSGVPNIDTLMSQSRRRDLITGQAPFAVILGCSDSRVPVEMVFDRGLGDLFVIRVAGNIVSPSQVGSVEFAAERFGTRLVIVLGHTRCGAVGATLDALRKKRGTLSPNLRFIVDHIRPSIEGLLNTDLIDSPAALYEEAVKANVRVAANHLRHGSEILEGLIARDNLLVVGAEYSLESGRVDFFDNPID